jgi:hypothetical protein
MKAANCCSRKACATCCSSGGSAALLLAMGPAAGGAAAPDGPAPGCAAELSGWQEGAGKGNKWLVSCQDTS